MIPHGNFKCNEEIAYLTENIPNTGE